MTKLRDRCAKMLQGYRVGMEPIDDRDIDALRDFVLSEIGRAADESLEDCAPLVLYFADSSGREDLLAALQAEKPGMVSRKWP